MKEVTYEEWQKNPIPREMWVWDNDKSCKVKRKVIYILNNIDDIEIDFPVVTLTPDEKGNIWYQHCAEIEEPKKRRMTKQELAWWLLDGIKEGKHREWKLELEIDPTIRNAMNYSENQANDFVKNVLVRENGGEWHEPLMEVEE